MKDENGLRLHPSAFILILRRTGHREYFLGSAAELRGGMPWLAAAIVLCRCVYHDHSDSS
jgi:hypothetical protein